MTHVSSSLPDGIQVPQKLSSRGPSFCTIEDDKEDEDLIESYLYRKSNRGYCDLGGP